MNPYDWKRNQPAIEVRRPEAGPMAAELERGGATLRGSMDSSTLRGHRVRN